MSATLSSDSSQSFDKLFPFLSNELTNPQGMTPQQQTELQTSGGQATSGALGTQTAQAQELAARTGNAAAAPAVIAAGGRSAMQQQSKNAMGVDLQNDQLKQNEQQDAAKQIQGLYGTSSGDALNALGISNNAIQIAGSQKPSFWQQMATKAAGNIVNAGVDAGEAGIGM